MNNNILRSTVAGLALCGVMVTSMQAPARADGASTTRTIIGAAALIAGLATAANVAHKDQLANTVEGYLPDGSVVYQDGHVVARNGYSWYPGNQGEQIACNGQSCTLYQNGNQGYYNSGNGYYNNGSQGYSNNGNQGYYNNGNQGYYNNGYYDANARARDVNDQRNRGDNRPPN
jgi:hypothetical protein